MADTDEETTEEQSSAPSAATAAAATRREERQNALDEAREVLGEKNVGRDRIHETLTRVVTAFTPKTRRSTGPRQVLEKVPPEEVAAYFESTGLARKQIAAAAGVSTSVIATVQNAKGDRWSRTTFEAKRQMIDAYVESHAAEIAAEAKARQDEADAKTTADAAKAARKASRAAAPAALPTAKAGSSKKSSSQSTATPSAQDGAAAA